MPARSRKTTAQADQSTRLLTGALVALIALFVGACLGWALKTAGTLPAPRAGAGTPASGTKAADLRVQLSGLLREQSASAITAGRAVIEGRADAASAATAATAVAGRLGNLMGTTYDADAGIKFASLYTERSQLITGYATAARQSSKAQLAGYRTQLAASNVAVADFLATADPGLSHDEAQTLLAGEAELLLASLDAHTARDFDGSYTKAHEAAVKVAGLADVVTAGIVARYPGQF